MAAVKRRKVVIFVSFLVRSSSEGENSSFSAAVVAKWKNFSLLLHSDVLPATT
jgi:hypothetical protein